MVSVIRSGTLNESLSPAASVTFQPTFTVASGKFPRPVKVWVR